MVANASGTKNCNRQNPAPDKAFARFSHWKEVQARNDEKQTLAYSRDYHGRKQLPQNGFAPIAQNSGRCLWMGCTRLKTGEI
jgi:hypothetical protein